MRIGDGKHFQPERTETLTVRLRVSPESKVNPAVKTLIDAGATWADDNMLSIPLTIRYFSVVAVLESCMTLIDAGVVARVDCTSHDNSLIGRLFRGTHPQ